MRLYLAGPWPCRVEIAELAKTLEAEGHTFTYRWWENIPAPESLDWCKATWASERKGVEECEVFILYWPASRNPGFGSGRETGLAEALHKPIFLVGNPSGDYQLIRASYLILASWEELTPRLRIPCIYPMPTRSPQELL